MKINQVIKTLEAEKQKIQKNRDKLRDLKYEINDLIESCDRAKESLECAVDALSEFV